jgi:hypothetical protein
MRIIKKKQRFHDYKRIGYTNGWLPMERIFVVHDPTLLDLSNNITADEP